MVVNRFWPIGLGFLVMVGLGCGYSGVQRTIPLDRSGEALVVAWLSEHELLAGYGDAEPRLVRLGSADGTVVFDYGKQGGAIVAIRVIDKNRAFAATTHSLVEIDLDKNQTNIRCRYADQVTGMVVISGTPLVAHAGGVFSVTPTNCETSPVLPAEPNRRRIVGLIPQTPNQSLILVDETPFAMMLTHGSSPTTTPVRADLYERGIVLNPDAVFLRNGKLLIAGGPRQDIRLIDLVAGVSEQSWEVGPFPRGLAVSADERFAYTLTTRGIAVVELSGRRTF